MSPHLDLPSSASSFASSSSTEGLRGGAVQSFCTSKIGCERKALRLMPGVYVPTVAFFQPDEELDLDTTARHAVRLAEAGVTGITTQGSNGEAVHLTTQERKLVTRSTREALDEAGYEHMPIIVGCAAQSTREVVELCHDAWTAGGDAALILPPSYYNTLYKKDDILQFFLDVADQSPIPVLIYNYPGGACGRDLSSDDIIELARHANIIGCKLTCGNTGKLNRIAAATNAATSSSAPSQTQSFLCMGGSADFTMQALMGGGSGIIAGLGNISPKALVHLHEIISAGKLAEAQQIQAVVARGDWTAIQGGVVGTRAGLRAWCNYGGLCRRPLPRPTKEEQQIWKEGFAELMKLESML